MVGDRFGDERRKIVRGTGEGSGERMRNIYIITHTESVHHVQGLAGGWYDTSLTEKGKTQAAKLATNLHSEIKLTGIPIYSSDLKRCAETAQEFAKVFGSTIILDKNLREMNFGECGGKTKEWYDKHIIPPPKDGNRLDHRLFNNAESRRECGQRAYAFINQLLDNMDKDVIVITHGHIRKFLIMAWIKMPVENMDYVDFKTNSGSVTLLSEDDFFGNRTIVYVNRLDFLKD
jgi:2,3-bisphosphoglycerate-dependent phosphoglycerate mutase